MLATYSHPQQQDGKQLSPPRPRRRASIEVNKLRDGGFQDVLSASSVTEPGALACRDRSPGSDAVVTTGAIPFNMIPKLLSIAQPFVDSVADGILTDSDADDISIDSDEDTLSYEECLHISETLGDVKRDEWNLRAEGEINQLPVEVYQEEAEEEHGSTKTEAATCLVCLQAYESNDVLRRLPCNHAFHICCADQWLLHKNACPCCRKPIDQV